MTGRLPIALGVIGLGLFFLVAARGIGGEAEYAGVGPRVFPTIVGGGLTLLGVVLGVSLVTSPAASGGADTVEEPVDRRAMAWVFGGLVLATVLLLPVGWIPAAAAAFVATARGFGSRRLAVDVLIGVVLATVVYLVFSRGLGISLPLGFLDRG